jgi:hypothetical protein
MPPDPALAFCGQAPADIIELFEVAITDTQLAAILAVPDVDRKAERPRQVRFQCLGIDVFFGPGRLG